MTTTVQRPPSALRLARPLAGVVSLGLVLGVTGCDPGGGPVGSDIAIQEVFAEILNLYLPPPGPDPCELLQTATSPNCGDARRLLPMPEGKACPPAPAGWLAPTTFELLTIGASYCAYERDPNVDSDEWAEGWIGDCPVTLQSTQRDIQQAWADGFEKWFDHALSTPHPTIAQQAANTPAIQAQKVGIAVIDTLGPNVSSWRNDHGPAMKAIAAMLSRGQAPISTYAGLPRWPDAQGAWVAADDGKLGYASDVAIAVDQAVYAWQQNQQNPELPGPALDRLIVSLSLAWELPDDWKSTLETDPAFRVLDYASANGVLVLAASGNQSPLDCGVEPAYAPAAWETLPLRPSANPGVPYAPMLYAISPVDHKLTSLRTSPARTHSRHATLGDQAVVRADQTPLGPLTGSSVSTAVMAGTAAYVWSYAAGLDAPQLMQLLWDTGLDVQDNTRAQLLFDPGTSNDARKVASRCDALAQLGFTGLNCQPSRPGAPELGHIQSADQSILPREPQIVDCTTDCGKVKVHVPKGMPVLNPVAAPQPGDHPCPPCFIDDYDSTPTGNETAALNIQLDAGFDGLDVLQVQVDIFDDQGNTESHFYTYDELSTVFDASGNRIRTNVNISQEMLAHEDTGLDFVGTAPLANPAQMTVVYVGADGRTYRLTGSIPVN